MAFLLEFMIFPKEESILFLSKILIKMSLSAKALIEWGVPTSITKISPWDRVTGWLPTISWEQ